ncbi:hypothetical protein FB451DRAFT_1370195 [Mycena latifolia]|nr:hypothetical protein FB451DRAFT_1370195 [Mycena latifolia]
MDPSTSRRVYASFRLINPGHPKRAVTGGRSLTPGPPLRFPPAVGPTGQNSGVLRISGLYTAHHIMNINGNPSSSVGSCRQTHQPRGESTPRTASFLLINLGHPKIMLEDIQLRVLASISLRFPPTCIGICSRRTLRIRKYCLGSSKKHGVLRYPTEPDPQLSAREIKRNRSDETEFNNTAPCHGCCYAVVANAGRRERDLDWFELRLAEWNAGEAGGKGPVGMELLEDFSCSISIPPSQTVEVAELLSKAPVQLTGLGARDSLRLEAGMCLYGNDFDEDTSHVEGGLTWVIGKERKEAGTFIGAEAIRAHLTDGPPWRRGGFIVEGAPARRTVTSGTPSPTLGKNIAMGYVLSGWHKKATAVEIEVCEKMRAAAVTPMPFVKPKY